MEKAKGNQAAELIFVPRHQISQAFVIASGRALQQMFSYARFFGHSNHHTYVIALEVDLVTGK